MVRIGTPINKPTPRSIVTNVWPPSLFLALLCSSPLLSFSLFLSRTLSRSLFDSAFLFLLAPFLFLLSRPSARRRFSFLSFRPLFYHVQGKPINHRIPPVYCGTPGCRSEPATSPALSYIPRVVPPPSRRSYFRKLPARGYMHAHQLQKWNEEKIERKKESEALYMDDRRRGMRARRQSKRRCTRSLHGSTILFHLRARSRTTPLTPKFFEIIEI